MIFKGHIGDVSFAKWLILLIISMFISHLGMTQSNDCNYSVSGMVFDQETKEPLPFVKIKLKNSPKGGYTDSKGKFFIGGLCSEKDSLLVTCDGYCDLLCGGNHEKNEPLPIYLAQEVQDLGPVQVVGEYHKEEGTQSISQVNISQKEIKNAPTKSLADLLSGQEGVSMISAGANVQLPVIHGLHGNRILILNNGLKHGFQNWGSEHAPEIDISSANSITVIKGATGVRFGPEALGGTIIVNPNPLDLNNPLGLEIGTGFQTNGLGMHSTLNLEQGVEKWSYFLNAGFTKIGDRSTPSYIMTNSGKEEKSVNIGVRYHSKKWDFRAYYGYVDQNLALLRSSVAESGNAFVYAVNSDRPTFIRPFSYAINEPNQLTQHQMGKAEVNWHYSDRAKLSFISGIQLNKREEYDVRRDVALPIIDLELLTTDYQLNWHHPKWFKLDGLIGIQVFRQENINNPGTQTTPFIPNYRSMRYSAFITETRKFNNSSLELGARVDYESNSVAGRETSQDIFRDDFEFTNATASIGYIQKISENTVFRTNLGTAWRTPNMAELFSFGQHGFKSSFGLLRYYWNSTNGLRTDKVIPLNESSVSPERGYKFTNELKIIKKKHQHTFTAYSHYIENYIFDRPMAVIGTIRGPMPVFVFDQTNAFFAGADYSWKANWTKSISGVTRLSYLWSWNVTSNETLINQPPASISQKFIWKQKGFCKVKSSELSVEGGYTFTQFQAPRTIAPEELIDGTLELTSESEIFDFKDAPDGYFLLNISWKLDWKHFSTGISATNVLNQSYRDYLNEMRYFSDEIGVNVLFTFNYRFKAKKKSK